jgi:uncharacterized protein YprB with RNaseH-like and TPR domain
MDITPTRLGFFDIEASNLDADFGHMISWCIKPEGKNPEFDVMKKLVKPEEIRILKSFLGALKNYDHLVGYYSSRFDIPFVRTRCLHYDLSFPEYGELWHTDLYFGVRGRLSLHRKRLETVSKFLKIEGKTPLDGKVWADASFGDQKSFKYILKHNMADVDILEKVYQKMFPYMKPVRRSV